MIALIDDHRVTDGVEPICKVLPIAPSTYHDHVAKRHDPSKLSARAKRDAALKVEVRRGFAQTTEPQLLPLPQPKTSTKMQLGPQSRRRALS